ncbi:MAG: RNA polymerase sigma factor [Acidimicrobiales bacterium]
MTNRAGPRFYAASIEQAGGGPGDQDQLLVQAVLAGNAEALDRLLRRHHDRLRGLCRRVCGNDADADDATQEALIAIARGLAAGRFDGRARFSTWAYRVATNACLDELRRRSRRPVATEAERFELESSAGAASAASTETIAGDRVDIDRALARLPVDFRAAVVLRDLCQLDYAEIAEVLGVPPGTVRSRIARGRAALVPLLGNRS